MPQYTLDWITLTALSSTQLKVEISNTETGNVTGNGEALSAIRYPLKAQHPQHFKRKLLSMNSGQKWYAVYTRPKWEKKVAELLTKKGIQNYCPVNKVVRQWSDRKKTVIEPLFTSYVFVRTTDSEHIKLKQTPGVINLVYWLSKPAVIRDVEIDMIQRFLDAHTNVRLERAPVNVNDIVRVTSGPLMEQEGVVKAVNSKTVKVTLPSLGFMMSAEVEMAHIEVVNRHLHQQEAASSGRFVFG